MLHLMVEIRAELTPIVPCACPALLHFKHFNSKGRIRVLLKEDRLLMKLFVSIPSQSFLPICSRGIRIRLVSRIAKLHCALDLRLAGPRAKK